MKILISSRLLHFRSFLIAFILLLATSVAAQSPNTSSLLVVVVDQVGAVVPGATVSVTNNATGAVRETASGSNGTATISGLPLTGAYTVRVAHEGFAAEERTNIRLRSGETATLRVNLLVEAGGENITVFGTTEGVRADPQIGRRFSSEEIEELPILGRKLTSVPLYNAAFRQAKGTGDLFVNQTYFATGSGSRRTTTFTLDGANNDEAWGRQTMMTVVPLASIQELTVLSNAFSAEYGWTSGPALNMVTKSGTNDFNGEVLFNSRIGSAQAKTFDTDGFCPPSVETCDTPATLRAINPVDIPDALRQYSASLGGPIVKDRTFFFLAGEYTQQDRTTFLSSTLPAFLLPADGDLSYTGHYRQQLVDARLDHQLTSSQALMLRTNIDRFYDDNPQDAVGGTNAPSVARRYSRKSWTTQLNHTAVLGANLFNEARLSHLNGDPVTRWEAQTLSTAYTRGGTAPFTIGQSRLSDLFGRQTQLSDTLSWAHGRHSFHFGGNLIDHVSGGSGNEPGTAVLGTFLFKTATTLPFDHLTLADVQSYTQPISFGIDSYELKQKLYAVFVQDSIRLTDNLTIDAGLRYDRQTLTDAKRNFAPRVGFGWHPGGDARTAIRGGYGMYYSQIQSNLVASYLVNGLDGLTTYTATPGQLGFPTCLTGACLPLSFDPRTLAPSQIPARDIIIQAGRRSFYQSQFASYGLDFNKLPNYPDELVNPHSQVVSIGAEREVMPGLFVGSDFVHQHWTDIVRTVDLNAPAPFDRTAPGQVRTVAAANATRPILPVNGGVRQVNVLTNLGEADYNGLQTLISYRGHSRFNGSLSYTLSKATNTTEPDGNGVAPNQGNIQRLGEEERGPSLLDQRHRAVLMLSYQFPFNITAGTVAQYASARPFSATTGVDNNGDGANTDRPVINGHVISRNAGRGDDLYQLTLFLERDFPIGFGTLGLRAEVFNVTNHENVVGYNGVFGNDPSGQPLSTFGQPLGGLANVDPARQWQFQARLRF
jgi:hypothetical protein